jgi:hypothetical protein
MIIYYVIIKKSRYPHSNYVVSYQQQPLAPFVCLSHSTCMQQYTNLPLLLGQRPLFNSVPDKLFTSAFEPGSFKTKSKTIGFAFE